MSNKRGYESDERQSDDDIGPIQIINANSKSSPMEVFTELVVKIKLYRFKRIPIQFEIFHDNEVQIIESTSSKAIAMILIIFRINKLLQRNEKLPLKSLHHEYRDIWGESTDTCHSTIRIFLDVFDWWYSDLRIMINRY
ncbi:uncharacterized protein KGF55_004433 [Candida pseudojiufengensis]|uniref:uncharacterized protein n=1 Tax=Candida pseudojiufengensis TaxID=497109 RepID=UPI0022250834|nr:uncharacterized protein KGF55_004433 [Candida pseudojiufengensis]KAI5960540.1 hypothetical protein KGF55_004433 [Candida pseudojiufengensis]